MIDPTEAKAAEPSQDWKDHQAKAKARMKKINDHIDRILERGIGLQEAQTLYYLARAGTFLNY